MLQRQPAARRHNEGTVVCEQFCTKLQGRMRRTSDPCREAAKAKEQRWDCSSNNDNVIVLPGCLARSGQMRCCIPACPRNKIRQWNGDTDANADPVQLTSSVFPWFFGPGRERGQAEREDLTKDTVQPSQLLIPTWPRPSRPHARLP
jgi:hypothetical protein